MFDDLVALDAAVYRSVARTATPSLDEPLRQLSDAADHSKIWIALAVVMALLGGRNGRRSAVTGLVAIGTASAIVNVVIKLLGRRPRPDRESAHVPAARRAHMPDSPSFPSGHTASGFAFAAAVAGTSPGGAAPIRMLASVVGYSRVHTGVHFPGDVIVGGLIGTTVGEIVAFGARRVRSRSDARARQRATSPAT